MSSLTKIPSGVQYFFDEEVKLRRFVERRAMEIFKGWSYDEIILPIFDYHELFARGMGEEKARHTYRFVDRDGALLALRPELTSLVARTVATRFIRRERPVRLCYSGEVFRYDDPAQRATREFHQLGCEQIGGSGIVADIEVLLVVAEVLGDLGLEDFRIALSHVDFFNGVADYLKLGAAERNELRELIDRRNSIALGEFLGRIAPGVDEARRRDFSDLIRIAGKREALDRANEILVNERSRAAVEHLSAIYETLKELGLEDNFDINLGDAGGLEYYTGLTFKVYLPGWGVEVGSGGRYDNLIASFGDPEPAIGFSLSLDGLTGALTARNGISSLNGEEPARGVDAGADLAAGFGEAISERKKGKRVKIRVR